MITFLKNKKLLFILIFLLAIFFRFNNLNWDSNFHLHPDERFLTMVGNAMSLPASLTQYLDPKISPMNPANINFPFFVYGVFPIVLNKILAVLLGNDSYNLFTIQGRFLSAMFDVLTVILVYKTAQLLFGQRHPEFISGSDSKKQMLNPNFAKATMGEQVQHDKGMNIPLWAAFFYAIAVLPIQLSHFFAVDTFLNFFMFGSFYFVLKSQPPRLKSEARKPRGFVWLYIFLSAIFFSFALSSKITAIYILPLNLFFLLTVKLRSNVQKVMMFLVYFLLLYIVLRFANPYYFESSNFLSVIPNKLFMQNLQQLQASSTAESAQYFPPAVQWFSKTAIFFPLSNIIFFGLGVPFFVCFLLGIFFTVKKLNLISTTIFVWFLAFFMYQATRFGMTMRYFIFLYPFIAIFSAFGLNSLVYFFSAKLKVKIVCFILILILLVWPISFSHIYYQRNSRVEASYWIQKNLPENSFLVEEHWDDWLPLSLPDINNRIYNGEQMPVFAPDTKEKWKEINSTLNKADYLIFTSNRGYGSIMNQPSMYPMMSEFYKKLFTGKLKFKKIKEFTSYPTFNIWIRNFVINDDQSEEAFTVYDHPKVLIFQKK